LKEKLGLSSSDLLLSVLRLPLFVDRVIDDAVMILLQDDDVDLLDKLLLSINDMNIFNGFVYQPLFSSLSFLSIKIGEILKGSEVQGSLICENVSFSDVNNFNFGIWHKEASFSVQPLFSMLK